jgi:hypothetical protein
MLNHVSVELEGTGNLEENQERERSRVFVMKKALDWIAGFQAIGSPGIPFAWFRVGRSVVRP